MVVFTSFIARTVLAASKKYQFLETGEMALRTEHLLPVTGPRFASQHPDDISWLPVASAFMDWMSSFDLHGFLQAYAHK